MTAICFHRAALTSVVAAIFLFVTNILGLCIGPSLIAFFTDFVYGDPLALRYSPATVAVFTCPFSSLIVWLGLKHYRQALKEAKGWISP